MSLPVKLKQEIEDLCLAKIARVNREPVECQTLEEAKNGLVAAQLVYRYVKRIGANTKTINHAAVLKAQWERKRGEFLRELLKAKGGEKGTTKKSRLR